MPYLVPIPTLNLFLFVFCSEVTLLGVLTAWINDLGWFESEHTHTCSLQNMSNWSLPRKFLDLQSYVAASGSVKTTERRTSKLQLNSVKESIHARTICIRTSTGHAR